MRGRQTRYGLRSRFLAELPEVCLKWLTPRAGQGGWREGFGAAWEGLDAVRGAAGSGDTDAGAHGGSDRGMAFRVGQSVTHPRFGDGVVVSLEGSGDDARAQVNFGPNGLKWLALSVARLAPAG